MTPTVDLALYCYEGDMDSLYQNLSTIVESHSFKFDKIHLIHQRCTPEAGRILDVPDWAVRRMVFHNIPEGAYEKLLTKFGIPAEDKRADEITHGPGSAHYWKHHVVNHLCAIDKSKADYIVFNDADCLMVRNKRPGWIPEAIRILNDSIYTFCISPSDGNPGKTWITSQQLFIARRKDLLGANWNAWDGNFINGGPFPEWYTMFEGRMGMYMMKTAKHRVVLGNEYRYWHGPIEHPVPEEFKEAVRGWK